MTIRRERVAPKESNPPKFRVVIPSPGEDEDVRIALNELPRQKPERIDETDEKPATEPPATSS